MRSVLKKWLPNTGIGGASLMFLSLLTLGFYFSSSFVSVKEILPLSQPHASIRQATLPLYFEKNEGQTDATVKYLSKGPGYTFYFTPQDIVMVLKQGLKDQAPSSPTVLKMQFVGANLDPLILGVEEQACKSNYFIGQDPEKWRTNISNYAKILYSNIYEGIDAIFYGHSQQFEYDISIAAGCNPQDVRLRLEGAKELSIDLDGNLHILTLDEQDVQMQKPFIYQMKENNRKVVDGHFVLLAHNEIGFKLGDYDKSLRVVIDPILSYSTYLGGSNVDQANGIAVDSMGNAYVVGQTNSPDFPIVAGSYQTVLSTGSQNAFITKLNPAGTALIYSTYLGGSTNAFGGSGNDIGLSIAVDANNNAYVAGATESTNFPTVSAYQASKGVDAFITGFVTKLNPAGSTLIYSTYLGGSSPPAGTILSSGGVASIAIDNLGQAYLTGSTTAIDFPVTANAVQSMFTGHRDAFITQLAASGSTLVYSTYLGGIDITPSDGSATAIGTSIAYDGTNGFIYITGDTNSINFPTTAGAFQGGLEGNTDAIVACIDPTVANGLIYSTYLGGNAVDEGNGIAVDSSGNAYVTGLTSSFNFPTTSGAFQTTFTLGAQNAFVAKLDPLGNGSASLLYSTYLGGAGTDAGNGIAIDSSGNAYILGSTTSSNFPTTVGAYQLTKNGAQNAFVTKLNSTGSALFYSTYFGGSGTDSGQGIALDNSDNAYITGYTNSPNPDFPITSGAFQTALKAMGATNGFIAKLLLGAPTVTGLSPDFGLAIGGTPVTLTGTGFTSVTSVDFGATAATTFTIDSDTQITVTSPAGTGSVDVTVKTPAATSTTSPNDLFNYEIVATTNTTLVVSPNPATVDQLVTLMATVTSATFGAITGSVIFYDEGTAIGSASLNSSGVATLLTSFSSLGTHSLVASYGGDSNFSASVSLPVSLTVNAVSSTSTILVVSPNPATVGNPVTLTAHVTSTMPGTPTGTVTFLDGTTLIDSAILNNGVASLTLNTFTVGQHSLTASYGGNPTFSGSTSPAVSLTVNQVTTTTTLSVSPNPSPFGQPVTFTAAVTATLPSALSPTGTVTFFDGTTQLGTVPLAANATAFLTISSLAIGSHSISAVYSGDSNFSAFTSSTLTLIVNPAPSNISPPTHLKGVQKTNRFATQTDNVNILTWQPPASGLSPVAYRIYRNANLTKLIGEVSTSKKLRFEDHNRKEDKTYTYFIVSVDQFGDISSPAEVTIKGIK